MRGNFKWKMLILFCLTFMLGFLSLNLSYSIFPSSNKKLTKHSQFIHQQNIKKALDKSEINEIQCVPVDENLKYNFIKEKQADSKSQATFTKKKTDLLTKQSELLNKLKAKKNLNKSEINDFKKELELLDKKLDQLAKSHPFYNWEYYGDIVEQDLLYREVCKETK